MPIQDIIGHERPKKILTASLQHHRLAHAYLFFGEERIGKHLVALRVAQALNCETHSDSTDLECCGTCRACLQIEQRTFPDTLWIEPDQERANPQIKIEQIREIEQHMIYQPLIGERKICIIDEADRMTINAANALLKTLEEPPAHSLFLLISSRPTALPATVRSRCQSIRFTAPPQTQVEAAIILQREMPPEDAKFLAMVTESRIGAALTVEMEDIRAQQQEWNQLVSKETMASLPKIMTMAEKLSKAGQASEALEWLHMWIRDLILHQIDAHDACILGKVPPPLMPTTRDSLSLESLLDIQERIQQFQRQSTRNINMQLTLESVLLDLRDVLMTPSPSPRPTA